MKKVLMGFIGFALALGLVAVVQYTTSNYMEPGGARWVVGGSIDVVSGGDLDIESGGAIKLAGTTITSTAAELNIMDGVTSTAAELNILDGVTSTAAELNILDGVTSTTAELNILDTVTSTAAELNILDGCTATFTELNLIDGCTKTTAELNEVYLTVQIPNVSAASSSWVVSPIAGNITKVYTVIDGAIATADDVVTLEIGGTLVTDSTITIANAGSGAGDVDSSTPSANYAITAGGAIEVVNSGASDNAVIAWVTIVITAT